MNVRLRTGSDFTAVCLPEMLQARTRPPSTMCSLNASSAPVGDEAHANKAFVVVDRADFADSILPDETVVIKLVQGLVRNFLLLTPTGMVLPMRDPRLPVIQVPAKNAVGMGRDRILG